MLEAFLVQVFYDTSVYKARDWRPTSRCTLAAPAPQHKLASPCYILGFFSQGICDKSSSLQNWTLWFVYADSDYRINDYLELKKKTNEKTGINQEHSWIKTLNIHT